MTTTVSAANIFPVVKAGVAGINKLTQVLAKTFFYDAFNFDGVEKQVRWMYKEPLTYGDKIRRISIGRVQIESYEDISGDEFKEKIPKLPNIFEEQYGSNLKFTVSTVFSALQNADKWSNAGEFEQYKQGMRGMVQSVLNDIPHLLLLSFIAIIDAAAEKIDDTLDISTSNKLDKDLKPTLEEFYSESIKKITKQTGTVKYNDSVFWNDLKEDIKKFAAVCKNIWHEDESNVDNVYGAGVSVGDTAYNAQFITLGLAIKRAVHQLNSPFPSAKNTIDTEPGKESDQTYPTNCKPGNMVLLINRDDAFAIDTMIVGTLPNIRTDISIHQHGIGTIVEIDGMPAGCFALFDKNLINLHMQYEMVFTHTNARTATSAEVHHWRGKWGWLTKVAGLFYLSKERKKSTFIKKKT